MPIGLIAAGATAALSGGEIFGGILCLLGGYGTCEVVNHFILGEKKDASKKVEETATEAQAHVAEVHHAVPKATVIEDKNILISQMEELKAKLELKEQEYKEFQAQSLISLQLKDKDIEKLTQSFLKLKKGITMIEQELNRIENKTEITGVDLKKSKVVIQLLNGVDIEMQKADNQLEPEQQAANSF